MARPLHLAALATAITIATSCTHPDPAAKPATSTTTVTSPPDDVDATHVVAPAETSGRNASEVAGSWACSYAAHPSGETPAELAKRLAPISAEELRAAIVATQQPDHGSTVVEAFAGSVTDLGASQLRVRCSTRTLDSQGRLLHGPDPVSMTVDVADVDGRFVVVDAAPNGVALVGADR